MFSVSIKIVFITLYSLYSQSLFANQNDQIERVWLTFRTNEPSHLVINWQSNEPGNSEVVYKIGNGRENRVILDEEKTLHHVEIPFNKKDVIYHYKVITNDEESEFYSIKGFPSDSKELRIAVVGNWSVGSVVGSPDFSYLTQENPHLLMTVGDNIPNLYDKCGVGVKDCIDPYLVLIDAYPELFQTTPFLPVLGNHDKQIRERGERYPSEAVYDTNATAYRNVFELPGDEWKWNFNIPNFDVNFVALDLNHVIDQNTTWQSCHDFHLDSDQFKWYKRVMEDNARTYTIILMNERSQRMRNVENGAWKELFEKGTAVIAGYGHYSEYAEVDEFPYFNTSLKSGNLNPDDFSKSMHPIKGYLFMTIKRGSLVIEMKDINGKVAHRSNW